MPDPSQIKVIVSDVHMGAGNPTGLVNPYEDFHHDDRLAELFRHYATGRFADASVELILAGDFLDLLKLRFQGRFPDQVDEAIAVDKVRRCILGHPIVFDALALFLAVPNHRVTYIAGNHDLEIAFPMVRKMMRARLGVDRDDSPLVFLSDQEFYRLPGGVVVTHGHMFEETNRIEPGQSLVPLPDGRHIVNMPWGSRFFMNVLAPFKAEQPIIDLVHPFSSLILWGLLFDLRFTLRVLGRVVQFFVRERFRREQLKAVGILKSLEILVEEVAMFNNLEHRAYKLLRSSQDIKALIVGHSHFAKMRRFPRDKLYVNTGTWVKIVSLELRDLGSRNLLTYVLVEYPEAGAPSVRLMRWRGEPRHEEVVVA